MEDENPELQNLIAPQRPAWMQLFFLVGMAMLGVIVAAGLGAVILKMAGGIELKDVFGALTDDMSKLAGNTKFIFSLKILQLCSSIGTFLLPAVALAYWCRQSPGKFLRIGFQPNILPVLAAMIAIVAIMPLTSYVYDWNMQIPLPDSLPALKKWLADSQKENDQLTSLFLMMPNVGSLFFNLVVIALIPAVAEEFLFRGALQKIFQQMFRSGHAAVWVTAIIFSAIHGQFLGFFPRILLGALLGYLFFFSGNLWYSVFAHMMNNGLQVLLIYLFQSKLISYNIDNNELPPLWIMLTCTLVSVGLIYFFILKTKKEKSIG